MAEKVRDWMIGIQGHRGLLYLEEMQDLIRSGALGKDDLVRRGVDSWKPASEYPELWRSQAPSITLPSSDSDGGMNENEVGDATGPAETRPLPDAEEGQSLPPAGPKDYAPFSVSLREKYYSLSDAIRLCSDAFSPLRLMAVAVLFLPVFPLAGFLIYLMDCSDVIAVRWGLLAFSGILLLGALSLSVRAIAYETRCHLDLDQPPFLEILGSALRGLFDMFSPLMVTLIPALLILTFLSLMGVLRDHSPLLATLIRSGYVVFLLLSLAVLANLVFIFLMLIYLPAVMVVEGKGVRNAISILLRLIKLEGKRLASHGAIIITVSFAMETALIGLGCLAWEIPGLFFREATDPAIREAWAVLPWLGAVYRSLIFGIMSVIPVSVAGTFSVISVLLLRQEERLIRNAYDRTAAPPGETAMPDDSGTVPDSGQDSGAAGRTTTIRHPPD